MVEVRGSGGEGSDEGGSEVSSDLGVSGILGGLFEFDLASRFGNLL